MANAQKYNSRVIMRIELFPQAKDRLSGMCDRLGITQVAAVSRLVEWFAEQTDIVQAAVMGLYPEDIRADIATLILQRLAGEKT
ncbi:MAG TPA: hypothetical protein VHX86_10890 [Tepidisphaeraceae bacterium]|jgi:hypothetical protein|nr:hypothetical protein [Tepidisphaeraceae bacterium]